MNLILVCLLIPTIGASAIALAGRWPDLRESITLATSVALALAVAALLPEVMAGERPALLLAQLLPGINVAFRVEPLGMLYASLASGLWIVNSIYSIGYMRGNNEKHQTRFYVCFAIALAAVMGIAFAENLVTLFLFYELLTLCTYPLVAHKGDSNSVASARVYLGILLTTSLALLLPAIVWTYSVAGTVDFVPGGILEGRISGPAVGLLLALFVFGIGKAAVMPVHRWLPAAMVAPTPVSALLHAVAVVKAGVFTVTKVILYVFGASFLAAEPSSSWLVFVAGFTILAASLIALRQQNLKRMLAYSTIGQLSYVIMAAAVLTPLSKIGASVHMIAHAFGKITLFFAAGAIYTASKKTEINQLAGIGRQMPWTMAAFTIGALSMIGVPPTAGFVSKWFILAGAFQSNNYVAIFTIIASTVLNAAYFLPIIFAAWFGRVESDGKPHGEAPLPIIIAVSFTGLATLLFFFFNQPVLDLERQLMEQ